MNQLTFFTVVCLSATIMTVAISNGEWHEKAEMEGQVPSFPETSISVTPKKSPEQLANSQRQDIKSEPLSSANPKMSIKLVSPTIDWLMVISLTLWLLAGASFIMSLKRRTRQGRIW